MPKGFMKISITMDFAFSLNITMSRLEIQDC